MERISVSQLRRFVVGHQHYQGRFVRARAADVEEEVRRLSWVQLDSISTVERSHRLTLTSRVGWYRPGTVARLLSEGRLFEYWAHEACLVPVEDWPLFTYRMRELRNTGWWRSLHSAHPSLRKQVLDAIRERGPLGSKDFEGKGSGGMWNWKPAKRMLDRLLSSGELVIAERRNFQRLYDLPERVIPAHLLEQPVPSEAEWLRGLAVRAIRGRGALTNQGIREHCRLKGGAARIAPQLAALEREGLIRQLEVEDGGPTVYVAAEAELDGRPAPPVFLSPFDNLLWDRPFARRVLGFEHLIEVYKRQHERLYGYYVLPFLWRDRFVGRADLKVERSTGTLIVRAFHLEPGVRNSGALDQAVTRALRRLMRTLELEQVRRESTKRPRRDAAARARPARPAAHPVRRGTV